MSAPALHIDPTALGRQNRVILTLGTRADLGAWRAALQAAGVCAVT